MRKLFNNHWPLIVIIIIAIASRLPQLFSANFILDGDECIMGIMAKHFAEGKTTPYFFYGQKYGFAFIEVVAIAIGYLLFGMSDYVVKLAVFSLWITGIVFCYKTLLSLSAGKWTALLFTLFLILTPTWAVWSMKARGGYITSFLCTNIVLYLLVKSRKEYVRLIWLLIGILIAITFFSQPLWLPGLLPFVVWGVGKKNILSKVTLLLTGASMVCAAIFMARHGADNYWQPNVIPGIIYPLKMVCRYAYYNFTGYYYLQNAMDAPAVINMYVYVFSALMCICLLAGIYMIVQKRRKVDVLTVAAVVSVIGTFSYFFIIDITSPRYAIPLTGYAVLMMFTVSRQLQEKLRFFISIGVVLLLIIGSVCMYRFKDYNFEVDKVVIKDAISKMQERGITHVFSTDPLLYWNFVFYSKEQIVGRHFGRIDRYIPYITETDSVYFAAPQKTAVLTRYSVLEVVDPQRLEKLNEVFYLYRQPDYDKLKQMNFEFE